MTSGGPDSSPSPSHGLGCSQGVSSLLDEASPWDTMFLPGNLYITNQYSTEEKYRSLNIRITHKSLRSASETWLAF